MTVIHRWYLAGIAVLVIVLGVFIVKHSVAVARAEEQQKASDKVIAATTQALTDRDKSFQAFQSQVLQEIAAIQTQKQAVTVLQPIIQPNGQPPPQTVTKAELPANVQAQLPGAPNTNYTLLTDPQVIGLAQNAAQCKLTEAGLTKCDADVLDFKAQIATLTKANLDWQKAGTVGPWGILAGAAKSNGTGNGWTPAVIINRRLSASWGLWAGAENRALMGGVSWNFGGPK
jgi:hypothetical protein